MRELKTIIKGNPRKAKIYASLSSTNSNGRGAPPKYPKTKLVPNSVASWSVIIALLTDPKKNLAIGVFKIAEAKTACVKSKIITVLRLNLHRFSLNNKAMDTKITSPKTLCNFKPNSINNALVKNNP